MTTMAAEVDEFDEAMRAFHASLEQVVRVVAAKPLPPAILAAELADALRKAAATAAKKAADAAAILKLTADSLEQAAKLPV